MVKVYMSVLGIPTSTVKTMDKKLLGEGTMDIKGFEIPKSEREDGAGESKIRPRRK